MLILENEELRTIAMILDLYNIEYCKDDKSYKAYITKITDKIIQYLKEVKEHETK